MKAKGTIVEDSKIVDLFLERDEKAILHTAGKYGSRLCALARRICGNIQTAQECENDTYYQAWNTIPPHEPRTYLFAYLSKIIRALAINRVRKDTRLKRNAILVELTNEIEQSISGRFHTETEIDNKLLRMAVSDFLRKQPEKKRTIFIRRYWYMDSISHISLLFSVSEGTVKTWLFRMRKELKEYLEKEGFFV